MSDPDVSSPLDYASAIAPAPRLAWLDPLVCGAIYAIGVAAIAGWPASFAGADDRIALAGPIAAVVAATGGVAASLKLRAAAWATLPIAAAAALAATVPTLWPMLGPTRWVPAAFALVLVGVATLGAVDVAALGFVKRRGAGGAASLVLLGTAAAAGGLAALTGSIRIAEKTIPLAIALLLAATVGAFLPARRALAGVAAFGIAVTIAQLASAHLWSDLALWQAACVLVAPVLAAVAIAVPLVARRRPWLRAALVVAIAALPAIVACGVAGAEFARASQADGASEYGY